MNKNQMNRI